MPQSAGRAKLVALAGEIGGRFSEETQTFIRLLARAGPPCSILSCAAARAFASSLLERRGQPGADGDVPCDADVLGDFCRVPPVM